MGVRSCDCTSRSLDRRAVGPSPAPISVTLQLNDQSAPWNTIVYRRRRWSAFSSARRWRFHPRKAVNNTNRIAAMSVCNLFVLFYPLRCVSYGASEGTPSEPELDALLLASQRANLFSLCHQSFVDSVKGFNPIPHTSVFTISCWRFPSLDLSFVGLLEQCVSLTLDLTY